MRKRLAPCLAGLLLLTTGCQLAENAFHNITYETKLKTAEVVEHHRFHKLARKQWEMVRCSHGSIPHSKDYAEGFKDGFVDFLQYGGNGQPPFVPPQRYWGVHYRTPDGYRAVEDWYAGFRHGASVAQGTGYRQWATVPSAAAVGGADLGEPVFMTPLPGPVVPDHKGHPHPTLPMPQPWPAPPARVEPQPAPTPTPKLDIPTAVRPKPQPAPVYENGKQVIQFEATERVRPTGLVERQKEVDRPGRMVSFGNPVAFMLQPPVVSPRPAEVIALPRGSAPARGTGIPAMMIPSD